MLKSVQKSFLDQLAAMAVQWLSDNDSAYIGRQALLFAL
jgi:putative transposase